MRLQKKVAEEKHRPEDRGLDEREEQQDELERLDGLDQTNIRVFGF